MFYESLSEFWVLTLEKSKLVVDWSSVKFTLRWLAPIFSIKIDAFFQILKIFESFVDWPFDFCCKLIKVKHFPVRFSYWFLRPNPLLSDSPPLIGSLIVVLVSHWFATPFKFHSFGYFIIAVPLFPTAKLVADWQSVLRPLNLDWSLIGWLISAPLRSLAVKFGSQWNYFKVLRSFSKLNSST